MENPPGPPPPPPPSPPPPPPTLTYFYFPLHAVVAQSQEARSNAIY